MYPTQWRGDSLDKHRVTAVNSAGCTSSRRSDSLVKKAVEIALTSSLRKLWKCLKRDKIMNNLSSGNPETRSIFYLELLKVCNTKG
jgi:hypothetical protein